jgi:hypothetical protein
MRVQRTRSSPSAHRSPLTRCPLGSAKWKVWRQSREVADVNRIACIGLVVLIAASVGALAQPVVGRSVRANICLVEPACPGSISDLRTVTSGEPIPLAVIAVDSSGLAVPGYTGTITFASSDPMATLAPSYIFTSADGGAHPFTATVLRTLGAQTISVSDSANSLSGSDTLTVIGSSASIPAIAPRGAMAVIVLLGVVGVWRVTRR